MKNYKTKVIYKIVLLLTVAITTQFCRSDKCDYITIDIDNNNPDKCIMTNTLNLSTGIDENNAVILPGKNVVDPFWKLLNNPPLISCSNPLTSSINGSAYAINFLNSTSTGWVNQPNCTTLCPIDLGTTDSFGCNNAQNSTGARVPYVFDRTFCVLKDTKVDFNFSFKGDDQLYLELINNNTNTVVSSSTAFVFPATAQIFSGSSVSLSAGSYSLRAYLTNTSSVVLGFSVVGNLQTTAGDLAISNNVAGCCENNTISILNILESNCNNSFDAADIVGQNYTFNLKNSAGTIIKTGITDVNGNLFFSGISDGTYTVEIVPQTGYIPNNPAGGTATFLLSGNEVKNITFYNCN